MIDLRWADHLVGGAGAVEGLYLLGVVPEVRLWDEHQKWWGRQYR